MLYLFAEVDMYFNRKCKITFVCHGATIYTDEGRFSDVENYPPLSELGVEEIEKICEFLKLRGIKNDAIYSSPALRTLQSAKMVSKLYRKDYIVIDELHPRKCGIINNQTFEQLEAKHPELLEKWLNNPDYDEELEAESINDFIKRIGNVINKLVEENKGNRIIVVTHPDVIQAAICSAIGIPSDKIAKIFIKPGSATQISYYEKWSSLMYCDCTSV